MTTKRGAFPRVVSLAALALSLALFCSAIQLKPVPGVRISGVSQPIGAEPPGTCNHVGCPCACNCGPGAAPPAPCSAGLNGTSISYSEGNLREQYPVVDLRSAFGSTLSFFLTYDSYNANGSRTQLDTGMGFGWTNSYNILLFSQNGNMFRMDGQGRVTKYVFQGGGLFLSTAGYFETLTNNMNGTFTLKQKDATTFLFAQIPNTPFLILGQIPFRLIRITDRNNNVTNVSYDANGNLTQVADTYGRSVTLGYDSQHHLTSIGDPLGRVTTLGYDSADTKLEQISDPAGKFTAYTYDANFQLIRDLDKDHRVFVPSYNQGEPVSITPISPSASPPPGPITFLFDLTNPVNWATDPQQLQQNQLRVYIPSTTTKQDGQGQFWQYSYDSNGYVDRAVSPDGATTSWSYDSMTLMPASMTDADGNTTSYQYDSMGNLLQRTDAAPFGFATTYTYESAFNQMTSMTDPNMRTTAYQIDPANGNRLSLTDPLGGIERWTYDAHGNVMTDTDKNGNTTTYMYDAFGNRVQVIDPLGNVTTTTYDAVGNVLSRTDANMHTTSYTYDGLDRLIQETDPRSNTTHYVYDGQGNRIQVTDRDGNATYYQYDLRNRLIKVTDALDQTTTSIYDGNDNVIAATDKNGHTTTFVYDGQNRRIRTTDALGDTSMVMYDPFGNVTSQTDANGHTTTYTYDQLNRQSTRTDAVGSVTSTFYDMTGPNTGPCMNVCTGPTKGSHLPSKIMDGDGNGGQHVGVAYYKYDGLDRRIQEVRKQFNANDHEPPDPNDAVTYTAYDAVGNVLTLTEPDGNATTYAYDKDNRRTTETNAAGDVTAWAYDGVGNVLTMTAPTQNVTNYTYDPDDRVTQVQDGGGIVGGYTYDPAGNRLTQTDGDGNPTATMYDAIYRITQVTDPLGRSASYSYDPVGNLLSTTDRNGNVTNYTYDAINRHITMTDALGNLTQYQYDAVGNLTRLTDANSHVTMYGYDGVNRLTTETYADSLTRSYTYDFVGNLTSRTDQNGNATNYTYSDLYFLLQRTYPISPPDIMTYDLSGRMLTATRGGWPVTFNYDGANRVLSDVQNGQSVNYTYDIPNRIITMTYPSARTITETMDLRSRLSRIDDPNSMTPIVQYNYDAADNVGGRAYRNGTTTAYTRNANYWVLNLQHTSGMNLIAGFNYTYDNEGNKQFENKLHDTHHSECYQYDAIYRIIDFKVGDLVGSCVPIPLTETQYTLDPVGNWPMKVTNGVPEVRTHNAVNEIVTINSNPLTYDHNGNLIADTLYTYAYDEENRLTGVTRSSDSRLVGQYQYDALSRRVQKIANPASPPNPVTTRYFYDGAQIIEEQNGVGMTQATYVYGNYIDEVLTMDRAAQTYYYHQNALWSVEAVTNGAGSPVERYSYDAYGLVSVFDGSGNPIPPNSWGTPHSTIGNPYLFTGRQLDEETGLYFYRARYYDTAKGRFLQRDRQGYVDGMNLYEYARGNPISRLDPLGEETITRDKAIPEKAGCCCEKDPKDCFLEVQFLNEGDKFVSEYTGKRESEEVKVGYEGEFSKGKLEAIRDNPEGEEIKGYYIYYEAPAVVTLKSKSKADVKGCHLAQDLTDRYAVSGAGKVKDEGSGSDRKYYSKGADNRFYGGWWFYDAAWKESWGAEKGDVWQKYFFQAHALVEEAPSVDIYWGFYYTADLDKREFTKETRRFQQGSRLANPFTSVPKPKNP